MPGEPAGFPATELHPSYLDAFSDWLACASAGAGERAPRAMRAAAAFGDERSLTGAVGFSAAAGHVLDFDDTLSDGVAHVSATTAPVALALAARCGGSLGDVLVAYAAGFEATAAVASASHPSLYDRGWHPTAVCGPIGAAVAASVVLGLSSSACVGAVRAALLRTGGTRGAFGSDGKALQVAMAAIAGLGGALLARAGAVVSEHAISGPLGFDAVFGATWPAGIAEAPLARVARADGRDFECSGIARNWIKLHPSCLGTHAPIEGAARLRTAGSVPDELVVTVHPVGRQAAHLDEVGDGLQAKFSIPYCVAHTLSAGPPRRADFEGLDLATVGRARSVSVAVDASLPQWGAVLSGGDRELVRVTAPSGAPGAPVAAGAYEAKLVELGGRALAELVTDPQTPASAVVAAAGLE